tara:strand:- start:3784 stop:4362 length:579 start_codon:yes stop_codon:yes gene_type:complete
MPLCRLSLILVNTFIVSQLCWATSIVSLDLPDLILKSQMIVQAKLINKEPVIWRGHIWTKLIFNIDDFLKGDGPSQIQVMQPGGQLGNYITGVAGTLRYEIDKNYCLFLWSSEDTEKWQIIGLSQGTFNLKQIGTEWFIDSDINNYSLQVPTILRSQLRVQLSQKDSRLKKLRAFYAQRSLDNLKSLVKTYE